MELNENNGTVKLQYLREDVLRLQGFPDLERGR